MGISITVEPNNKKKANGMISLMLRLTIDRKLKRHNLGIEIRSLNQLNRKPKENSFGEKEWIKSGNNKETFNAIIKAKIDRVYENRQNILEEHGREGTHEELFDFSSRTRQVSEYLNEFLSSIPNQATKKSRKYRYATFTNWLKDNHQSRTNMDTISPEVVTKYKTYLINTKGLKSTTTHSHFKELRTAFNEAVKLGYIKSNPFNLIEVKKGKHRLKETLTIKQVEALEELNLQNKPKLSLTRDAFLFSFYVAGIRCKDVLTAKWSDIKDDRITITANKTGKVVSVLLHQKLISLLDKYKFRRNKNSFIFPFCDGFEKTKIEDTKFFKHRESKHTLLNKDLKVLAELIGVEINLTMHSSRHSFASWLKEAQNKDTSTIQTLLGHSTEAQTLAYLRTISHDMAELTEEIYSHTG